MPRDYLTDYSEDCFHSEIEIGTRKVKMRYEFQMSDDQVGWKKEHLQGIATIGEQDYVVGGGWIMSDCKVKPFTGRRGGELGELDDLAKDCEITPEEALRILYADCPSRCPGHWVTRVLNSNARKMFDELRSINEAMNIGDPDEIRAARQSIAGILEAVEFNE